MRADRPLICDKGLSPDIHERIAGRGRLSAGDGGKTVNIDGITAVRVIAAGDEVF